MSEVDRIKNKPHSWTEAQSDMNSELASQEQHRDKTGALRQAVTQELLTGRTRLL